MEGPLDALWRVGWYLSLSHSWLVHGGVTWWFDAGMLVETIIFVSNQERAFLDLQVILAISHGTCSSLAFESGRRCRARSSRSKMDAA